MENIKDPILQIKDVCISYTSDVMAVKHVSADIEKKYDYGHHGAFWMWKEYVAACREPHARVVQEYPCDGRDFTEW